MTESDFGLRLAQRVTARAGVRRHLGGARSIGMVSRSAVGFGQAVGRSRQTRPRVTADSLTSLQLRPPAGWWNVRGDAEAEPAPPSWTDDLVPPTRHTLRRTAATKPAAAAPAAAASSAPAPAARRAPAVPATGNRLADLFTMIAAGRAPDGSAISPEILDQQRPDDDVPVERVKPSPAAKPRLARAPQAPGTPVAEDWATVRHGTTEAGLATGPGALGRRLQPEVVEPGTTAVRTPGGITATPPREPIRRGAAADDEAPPGRHADHADHAEPGRAAAPAVDRAAATRAPAGPATSRRRAAPPGDGVDAAPVTSASPAAPAPAGRATPGTPDRAARATARSADDGGKNHGQAATPATPSVGPRSGPTPAGGPDAGRAAPSDTPPSGPRGDRRTAPSPSTAPAGATPPGGDATAGLTGPAATALGARDDLAASPTDLRVQRMITADGRVAPAAARRARVTARPDTEPPGAVSTAVATAPRPPRHPRAVPALPGAPGDHPLRRVTLPRVMSRTHRPTSLVGSPTTVASAAGTTTAPEAPPPVAARAPGAAPDPTGSTPPPGVTSEPGAPTRGAMVAADPAARALPAVDDAAIAPPAVRVATPAEPPEFASSAEVPATGLPRPGATVTRPASPAGAAHTGHSRAAPETAPTAAPSTPPTPAATTAPARPAPARPDAVDDAAARPSLAATVADTSIADASIVERTAIAPRDDAGTPTILRPHEPIRPATSVPEAAEALAVDQLAVAPPLTTTPTTASSGTPTTTPTAASSGAPATVDPTGERVADRRAAAPTPAAAPAPRPLPRASVRPAPDPDEQAATAAAPALRRPGRPERRRPGLGAHAEVLRRALAPGLETVADDRALPVAPALHSPAGPDGHAAGAPTTADRHAPARRTATGAPIAGDRREDAAPLPGDPVAARRPEPAGPGRSPDVTRVGRHVRSDTGVALAERFMTELATSLRANPAPLPTPFRPMADEIAGRRPVMLATDAATRRALRSVGKRAATVGATIHVDAAAHEIATPTQRITEIVAHELTHVAHHSPAPRFFDDVDESPEERRADAVARLISRSPLAPMGATIAAAPTLARRPTGADPTEVVRRMPSSSSNTPARASAGTISAADLAASITGRTAGTDVVRRSLGTAPPAPPAEAAPDPVAAPAASPAAPARPSGHPIAGSPADRDEEFREMLERNLDVIIRRVQDHILIDIERRGGRAWRGY